MKTREERLFAVGLDVLLGPEPDEEFLTYLVDRECLRRRQSETAKRVWAGRRNAAAAQAAAERARNR